MKERKCIEEPLGIFLKAVYFLVSFCFEYLATML